ncbi:MAG: preprotein translocase subunit SecY [archaeon]|jgi:preprotein translocase subunit SecY
MGIIDYLTGISALLPEIKAPEKEVPFKQKIFWTLLAIIIFFVLGNVWVMGLDLNSSSFQQLLIYQTLLASHNGTLISSGISPIVMASIFLQLFVGAKILNLSLSDPEGRAKFQALQKLFIVVLCFVEAFILVVSGLLMPIGGNSLGNPLLWMITLQVAAGSLILLYLDEIVSKYGIGSGVSLFIAAGVSSEIFWQIFRPPIISNFNPALANGGILWNLFTTGNFLVLLPIVGLVIIFLVVVFAEGMHVNIPITMGYRGTGGRYPVKFLYVSNMPVILAMALFSNVRIWATFMKNVPLIGGLMNGIAGAVVAPSAGGLPLFQGLIIQGLNATTITALGQAGIYMIVLIAVCVIFGWFWVQMGNQSSEAVAEQLQRSGMQIPGFRKDKRIIERVLMRYIPPITILGSIFVALLSGFGDMILYGLAYGTGILLTVGIIYRFYEEIARSQAEKLAPLLGKL